MFKTFDEYAEHYDVIPTNADAYLRRFCPDYARDSEWRRKSPAECVEALREVIARARGRECRSTRAVPMHAHGAWHYTSRGVAPAPPRPAPARRFSASPAVRVAGPITETRRMAGGAGVIAGYAAMFNRASVDLGNFREVLAPGAFRSTLAKVRQGQHDVLALAEHDHKSLLGRMSAGNLTLEEDASGLRFQLELPNTQLGRDVRELVGRGILRGMSFSFAIIRDAWSKEGGTRRRTVHDLTMFEVSVVGSPAYPATSVAATRANPAAEWWTGARLRAIAAKPTRGAAAVAVARSTADRLWR
jgi:HK97 family phage prohead protease